MSNPLDDPTCHDCPIAQGLRAARQEERAEFRDLIDALHAEIGILKGTSHMPGVQRVTHGEHHDEPPRTR